MARRQRRSKSADSPDRQYRPPQASYHPAHPTRPALGCLYFHNANGYFSTASYTNLRPFASIINQLTQQYDKPRWQNPHTLQFDNGLRVSCDSISHLYEQHTPRCVPQFLLDRWQHNKPRAPHDNLLERIMEDDNPDDDFEVPGIFSRIGECFPSSGEPSQRQQRAERRAARADSDGPRPERQPSARSLAPPGLTHISVIAQSLGLEASQARDAMRRSGTTKPDWGWQCDAATIPVWTALIQKHKR